MNERRGDDGGLWIELRRARDNARLRFDDDESSKRGARVLRVRGRTNKYEYTFIVRNEHTTTDFSRKTTN